MAIVLAQILIVIGKIWSDGEAFPVKGIDYASWLLKTDPDPSRGDLPFPKEFEDVTDRASREDIHGVSDYSGDNRIQAWEVIPYDIEDSIQLRISPPRRYQFQKFL
jgi:hypothetical protein